MEGMGYDYTSTPKPQPDDDEDDDDDDVPPPAQENAPEPLPGGMVVGGFFSSRVTIQRWILLWPLLRAPTPWSAA